MTALTGALDGFNGRGVFGWLLDRDDDSPQSVDIYVDGSKLGDAVPADRFRQDLFAAGISNGRHGFAWELPTTAEFGDSVTIAVTLADSNQQIFERVFHAPYSESPWRGRITGLAHRELRGWVKQYGSNAPMVVDVFLDEQRIASNYVCNVAGGATIDGGNHGFAVPITRFKPTSPTVTASLRLPDGGSTVLSQEFDSSPLKDVYRGHIETSGGAVLRGWAVNENWPADTFSVEILLDGHPYLTMANGLRRPDLARAGLSAGRGGFEFANPVHHWLADGDEHTWMLRFPDGTTTRAYKVASPPCRTHGPGLSVEHSLPLSATVIVPVYNAADDLEVCIDRLLEYTPDSVSILIIDDCSPDPRIAEILSGARSHSQIRVLRNDVNLGFTKTVNRGIKLAETDNVVLLNSDARVTPGWLEGMAAAASSSARIATVTAMSDRAGAFSAPTIGNENSLPDGVDEITYARAFRRRSLGVYPRVPTGNGFCMWISRACIDDVGLLDEVAFPRGYGEENDFCMRAGRAGWIHVIDDRTYVFHDRSKSFGESKSDLLAAGRAVVDERFPEYKHAIRAFRESAGIALARNRASIALTDTISGVPRRPRVLYVTSTTTGGTPQTNADLMGALDDAIEPWIFRCDSKVMTLSRVVDGVSVDVCTHELIDPIEPVAHFSPEYDNTIAAWLRKYNFDVVHIRHLLWHSLSLPRVAKDMAAKVVMSFHDYYALSPNLKLIDDFGEYLGDKYVSEGSVYRESGWPTASYPTPSGAWLRAWRERFWRAIQSCDEFVTTSDSARELILAHFPEMNPERFTVIEHGRDFKEFLSVASRPRLGEPLKILVPGGINAAKGLELLRELAATDPLRQVEWHVLGPMRGKIAAGGARVVHHGKYKREDFSDLVAKIAPHAGAVLSVWDETYCHTLTEMWSVGLPVFVLDFPNVSQRVRRFDAGWVLQGVEPASLLTQVVDSLHDPAKRLPAVQGVLAWQSGWGLAWTTKQMALRYLDIYRRILRGDEARVAGANLRVGVLAPASRDLKRAPASTYVRAWERTRNSIEREVDYIRITPDMAIASVEERLLDALIVQRTAVPAAAATRLLSGMKAATVPLILELDDDLTATSPSVEGHPVYVANAPTMARLLRSANALSVSTQALRDRFGNGDMVTEVFPAALSDRLWRVGQRERVNDDVVRALYFGTRTHSGDLKEVMPALDAIARSVPNFELVLAGIASGSELDALRRGRPWLSVAEVPEDKREYPQFVELLRELSSQIDLAIAPLADTGLNAHKSDLKLLEYLSLGLRSVASAVGPYAGTEIPGVRVVPNSTKAWTEALTQTIREVGEQGPRIDESRWLRENRMVRHEEERFDLFVRDSVRRATLRSED